MQLSEEALGRAVERMMTERFIAAAALSAKKARFYAEMAEDKDVRRHLHWMAEANDQAIKQLEALMPRLREGGI